MCANDYLQELLSYETTVIPFQELLHRVHITVYKFNIALFSNDHSYISKVKFFTHNTLIEDSCYFKITTNYILRYV